MSESTLHVVPDDIATPPTDLPDGSRSPWADVSTERLVDQVCELAARLAATTYHWLTMLAELDRRRAWADWQMLSCAHWLSWRCGLGLVAARDHVRVARALSALPQISAAFAAGRLSFSKVRAITRITEAVDSPELEAELLDLALASTAAQTERLVRGYRRANPSNDPDNSDASDAEPPAPEASWYWDDHGHLVLSARLGPLDGANLIAAMHSHLTRNPPIAPTANSCPDTSSPDTNPSIEPSDQSGDESAAEPDNADAEPDNADADAALQQVSITTRAEALAAVARTALAAGPVDTTGADRHVVHIHIDGDVLLQPDPQGKHTDEHTDQPTDQQANGEAEAAEAHAAGPDNGHDSTADPSKSTVADSAESSLPSSPDTEAPEASEAPMTAVGRSGQPSLSALSVRRGRCQISVGGIAGDGPALSAAMAYRLLCDTALRVWIHDADGRPLKYSRSKRLATAAQRRLLLEREHGRCAVTGCTHTRYLEAHHIVSWLRGGLTDPENLILLCSHHHDQVHEGRLEIIVNPDGSFSFRTNAGHLLPAAPPQPTIPTIPANPGVSAGLSGAADRVDAGAVMGLIADLVSDPDQTADITPDTLGGGWNGDRLDLDATVSGLLQPHKSPQQTQSAGPSTPKNTAA